MARVFISLGSNVEREKNIRSALAVMASQFGELEISPVYQTTAVGFDGDDFYNLVAGFSSRLAVEQIVDGCHAIEDQLGRDRSQPRFSARIIDLDVLLYDDLVLEREGFQLPRAEILENAFVLRPLQDLIPEQLHPLAQKSYAELWQQMQPNSCGIHQVEFSLSEEK